MRTINEYLDLAKEKQELTSDRKLAEALDSSHGMVSNYRLGRAFPSEEIMVKIAELAGLNPVIALIELHEARNFDNPAATIYQQMKTALVSGKKIASYALVAGAMGLSSGVDWEPTATAEDGTLAPKHFILWEILN